MAPERQPSQYMQALTMLAGMLPARQGPQSQPQSADSSSLAGSMPGSVASTCTMLVVTGAPLPSSTSWHCTEHAHMYATSMPYDSHVTYTRCLLYTTIPDMYLIYYSMHIIYIVCT